MLACQLNIIQKTNKNKCKSIYYVVEPSLGSYVFSILFIEISDAEINRIEFLGCW